MTTTFKCAQLTSNPQMPASILIDADYNKKLRLKSFLQHVTGGNIALTSNANITVHADYADIITFVWEGESGGVVVYAVDTMGEE